MVWIVGEVISMINM